MENSSVTVLWLGLNSAEKLTVINNIFLLLLDQAHNVTIVDKGVSLRSGSQHEFVCMAIGSRPAAVLTWWFDDVQVRPKVDNLQVVSDIKQRSLILIFDRLSKKRDEGKEFVEKTSSSSFCERRKDYTIIIRKEREREQSWREIGEIFSAVSVVPFCIIYST